MHVRYLHEKTELSGSLAYTCDVSKTSNINLFRDINLFC